MLEWPGPGTESNRGAKSGARSPGREVRGAKSGARSPGRAVGDAEYFNFLGHRLVPPCNTLAACSIDALIQIFLNASISIRDARDFARVNDANGVARLLKLLAMRTPAGAVP